MNNPVDDRGSVGYIFRVKDPIFLNTPKVTLQGSISVFKVPV